MFSESSMGAVVGRSRRSRSDVPFSKSRKWNSVTAPILRLSLVLCHDCLSRQRQRVPHIPSPTTQATSKLDKFCRLRFLHPLELVPPEHRFISSQLYPDLLLNLKDFIGGVVNDLGIGNVPWEPASFRFRCSEHLSSEGALFLSKNPLQPSSLQPRNLHRAPRIPSIDVNTVTLLEQIRASRWSSIYTCRLEGAGKLCIMKLVSERHSEMVLRELYMYDVVLKGCSLVPRCYGTFQRPAGGWFGFLLDNVGDSLEEVYGSDWDDVKMGLGVVEWKNLVDSVKRLHLLGVIHGDLEPRIVARTREGTFKFFDFGRSEVHRC